MESPALEWVKVLAPVVISWPTGALVFIAVFRRPLLEFMNRFVRSAEGKADIGPLKIEFGKLAQEGKDAVGRLNRLTELMAETRLLELEITDSMFAGAFTDEQRQQMRKQIEELKSLMAE